MEQCIFAGKILSSTKEVKPTGLERGTVLEFAFVPSSSVTVLPSYVKCEKYHHERINVRTELVIKDLDLSKGDRALIHYHYQEFECGEEAVVCRSRSYRIVKKGGWPSESEPR